MTRPAILSDSDFEDSPIEGPKAPRKTRSAVKSNKSMSKSLRQSPAPRSKRAKRPIMSDSDFEESSQEESAEESEELPEISPSSLSKSARKSRQRSAVVSSDSDFMDSADEEPIEPPPPKKRARKSPAANRVSKKQKPLPVRSLVLDQSVTKKTIDDGESDDEEEDWNEVVISPDGSTEQLDDGNISFTIDSSKRKKKGITKGDREARADIHRVHSLALVASIRHRNWQCDNQLLHAVLLSQLPGKYLDSLQDCAEDDSKFKKMILGLCKWWKKAYTFHDYKDEVQQEFVFTLPNLVKCARDMEGTKEVASLLFISLCRAMGIHARIVASLTPISLRLTKSLDALKRRKSLQWESGGSFIWTEIVMPDSKKWSCLDSSNPASFDDRAVIVPKVSDIVYIVAMESGSQRVKDITPKYVEDMSILSGKTRCEPWWQETVLNAFNKVPPADDEVDRIEDAEIEERLNADIIPTSISAFLNHPKYVLERHLKKFEYLHPKSSEDVIGQIRNIDIYPRANVKMLHTAEKWLSLEGRVLKPDELALKLVKSRSMSTMRESKGIKVLLDEENDDPQTNTGGMVGLFGEWQTEVFVPPPIVNGIIPKNKYQNIDMYKPSMLPEGAVHLKENELLDEADLVVMQASSNIRLPSLKKIVRGLDIDFSEAVTGFDYHCGFSVPRIEGLVVASEHEELVKSKYLH
eukprot:Partr_v1_DN27915_c0_g1_i2_m11811 putative DNA repair protein